MTGIEALANDIRIQFSKDALRTVFLECDQHDHSETGGRLVGFWHRRGDVLHVEVTGVIEPGPNARRSATSFFQDGDYQASVFRILESKYPRIEHLGNWHTHHVNGCPTLSRGDRQTYRRIVEHSQHNTDFFYALLVVERNPEGQELDRYRVRHYVLHRGGESAFEIPADLVTLVDDPCIWPESKQPATRVLQEYQGQNRHIADQTIFAELYPHIRPCLSRRTQLVTWKGHLQLVDGSEADVQIVETGRSGYRVILHNPQHEFRDLGAELAEALKPSAAQALQNAERVLNRSLYVAKENF